MAWTAPRTWVVGELVTATLLNQEIRDNLGALKNPQTDLYQLATDYSTSSTGFVDVDATNLSLTLSTVGGDVLVGFAGTIGNGNDSADTGIVYFDITVDTIRIGGTNGFVYSGVALEHHPISFVVLVQDLDPGSHTFKLQWKVNASGKVGKLITASAKSQFWAREVS